MLTRNGSSDHAIARGVIAGDRRALDAFLQAASAAVWPVVRLVEGDGAEAEAAFLAVVAELKAHDFVRLRRFEGRSSLTAFLALTARDVLADRSARAFAEAPERAWRRFERLFGRDIRRRIRRRFPRADEAQGEDLYQEVCLRLVEDNYRRLRAYGGAGSFGGYIAAVVERLLLDLLRREAPRRRLPAEVERASPLHRAVFEAVAWAGTRADPTSVRQALGSRWDNEAAGRIEACLDDLAQPIAAARVAAWSARPLSLDEEGRGDAALPADETPSAEERLIAEEGERAQAAFLDRVRRQALTLQPDERRYLQMVLEAPDPLAPRDIARLLGRPVDDVYRLRQRMHRWLREMAVEAENVSGASV
jgi:RNA polymerase primary sigma factor